MKKIVYIVIVLIISFGFSCKKSKNKEVEVQGIIKLHNQVGYMINSEDVQVSLSGIEDTVLTDETGIFHFENIPEGTYEMTVSKAGFPEFKIYGIQILANGQQVKYLNTLHIAQLPTIKVQNFRDTVLGFLTDIKADIVKKDIDEDDYVVLIMYASHSPNVSINNYETKRLQITNKNYLMLWLDYWAFGLEDGMYIVFYAHPYSSSHAFDISQDSVVSHPFNNLVDEYGYEHNPYYTKVSEVYYYDNKKLLK